MTPANVNKAQFGMLFKRVVDDQLYTQPLVATNVPVAGGTHDIVYVTTVNNSVYAFDANDAEAVGAPVACQLRYPGQPAQRSLWLPRHQRPDGNHRNAGNRQGARRALCGCAHQSRRAFTQRLHALDLATGADLPESPIAIKAADFNPLMQNQRPALMLANGMVYVGYASHCDKDPYHGFLMAYDAKTLQQVAVFNTSPTGMEASIWQSGQGPAADADGNVYVVTGNGSWDGVKNFSESFLKFSPNLDLLDWFTPTNHFALDKADNDLNSSGATLIPGTHLVLGGGKEGVHVCTRHAPFRTIGRRACLAALPSHGLAHAQPCLLEQREAGSDAVRVGSARQGPRLQVPGRQAA